MIEPRKPFDIVLGEIRKSVNFGDFKVVEYIDRSNVVIEFIATQAQITTYVQSIRTGQVKDPFLPNSYGKGYVGELGTFKNHPLEKSIWTSMLSRCYCPTYLRRFPTYKDCYVVEDWHNFSNFVKWFKSNYVEGYRLDKDFLIPGNKEYGPDTCLFIPANTNGVIAQHKKWQITFPDGAVLKTWNLAQFCKSHKLSTGNMQSVASGQRKQHKGFKCKRL